MTVLDCLDALRNDIPGCQVAAFGDAEAHLILKASHDTAIQRELLDDLCADAARCFAMAKAVSDSTASNTHSVTLTERDMRIHLRLQGRPDFLCLLCPLEIEPVHVVHKGFETLAQLVEVA